MTLAIDPWGEPPPDHFDDEAADQAAAFAREVEQQAWRLRVTEAARAKVAAERAGEGEPFDADLLADLLARPEEPPYRAEGLIPSDAGVLIVAQRKAGKTTFELNLAKCLIDGDDLLDQFPVRPITGRVGLLNFEVSASQIARWADEVGVDHDRLYVVNLRGRRNPLVPGPDREALAKILREQGVESLIVDPFGRAYTGTSQNDNGEVGAWLIDLDLFARSEVGARDLILAVHAGWDGERTRGASALEDWADVVITMTRDENGERYLRAFGRDVELDEDRLDFDPATRRLTLSGAGSRKKAKAVKRISELAVHVIEAVGESPGINTTELEKALRDLGVHFQKGDVAKAATQATATGHLRMELGARGAKCYFLAGASHAA